MHGDNMLFYRGNAKLLHNAFSDSFLRDNRQLIKRNLSFKT